MDCATSVPEVVDAHEAWLAMRRAPGTVTVARAASRSFVDWAGDRPLSGITTEEIEFKFLGPWSQSVSVATRRNRIAALRSLFDFAERFDLAHGVTLNAVEPLGEVEQRSERRNPVAPSRYRDGLRPRPKEFEFDLLGRDPGERPIARPVNKRAGCCPYFVTVPGALRIANHASWASTTSGTLVAQSII